MIRAAAAADAAAIAALYAPHVSVGHASFEDHAPDAAEMARRIGEAAPPWLVATDGAVLLGYAQARPFNARAAYRWTVETGVYVADDAQRRGIGRALYDALLRDLERRGFAQAIARIALPGAASEALHAALGFRAIGTERAVGYKHGRWVDVALWQRTLADLADPPREPDVSGRPQDPGTAR